jgi:hypothetical protein
VMHSDSESAEPGDVTELRTITLGSVSPLNR